MSLCCFFEALPGTSYSFYTYKTLFAFYNNVDPQICKLLLHWLTWESQGDEAGGIRADQLRAHTDGGL